MQDLTGAGVVERLRKAWCDRVPVRCHGMQGLAWLAPSGSRIGLAVLFGVALGLGLVFWARRLLPRMMRPALASFRRGQRTALKDLREHLRVIFQNSPEGILMFTPEGCITSCNPAIGLMFGRDPALLRGTSVAALLEPLARLSAQGSMPALRSVPREAIAFRGAGEAFPVDLRVSEVSHAGKPRFIAVVRDISDRKQAETRLTYLTHYDSLTGLPNRSLFRDRLAQAMARVRGRGDRLALIFLDLDRFKTINEALGHEVGDRLLKQVAAELERELGSDRAEDGAPAISLSRLGGDEFTVIAEGIPTTDAAAQIARRILAVLVTPFELGGPALHISASIGVTVYPDASAGLDADDLIRQADLAMYRAKERGRNTYFFYNEALNREMAERHALEARLRQAVDQNAFHLHFQPKADLASGAIVGVEALLRWNSGDQPPIGPDRFVPILEETGLIIPVGEWVLDAACAQLAAWRAEGQPPLRLAVNFSARQFQHETLPDMVAQTLARHGLAPELLEVELTESTLMEDREAGQRILSRLAAMGTSLAIDDFGTGHSSLAYLRRFKVNTLKIDRSFVSDIPGDPEGSAIAGAILGMAASLGIQVVAEGVETEAQVHFLKRHGCDQLQGYLLSRPLAPDDFAAWLRAYRGLPLAGAWI
ncbi:EAL domain-containing protein [Zoogloea sp.]|uniref:putative bifunctional diguanylate cyclase/phosphodiesterase n=1 Tax=Zoogloea sp. TaxID=49181 RepID=UPI001416A1AE|nr:MAG: EAL domain-containing protein [Zoogloea sp.]